jgi:DNA gyrase subunit A
VDESAELQLEDLIADEQVAVTVSHQGYLKRTPIASIASSGAAARGAWA